MSKTFLISFAAALLVTNSAYASVFSMIDCLSANGDADVSIHLKDVKTTEYARLYNGLRGYSEQIEKGTTVEFSENRFYFTGTISKNPENKTEKKQLSIEIDLHSIDVNNGKLTINGSTQAVQCFNSEIPVED
jgi:hypothetical protein